MNELNELLHRVLFRISETDVTPIALLIFVVTLVMAIAVGHIGRRSVTRLLIRYGGPTHEGVAYALGRIAQYIIVGLGLLMALETVGFSMKSLAALGAILAVGIGFGLQNIAQNFASGIILLIERPVQKGDFIDVGGVSGTVEDIAMRATRILTRDGIQIIVPNSELVSSRVVNRSAPTPRARARIKVGVAYGSDTEMVRSALQAVAAADARVLQDPPPKIYFRDFGDNALMFELAIWMDTPEQESTITSDLRFAIDKAFRGAHIEVAYPQRDLHIRSGLEGLVSAVGSISRP